MAKRHFVSTWVFGVVLPLLTIGVELLTSFCAEVFFDPMPSFLHVLLCLLVPAGNVGLMTAGRRDEPPAWAFVLHGVALGTASFYALLFLPLLPIALIGLILFGLGLLPLTPLLSFVATLLAARRHRSSSLTGWVLPLSPRLLGFAAAVLSLFGVEARTTITRAALRAAAADDAEMSRRGLRWLRAVGNETTLRRLCYDQTGLGTDIVGFLFTVGDPVSTDEARQVYYRVTGQPFNSVPRPPLPRRAGRRWDGGDSDLGGNAVGGVVPHLDLQSSRLDVSVDRTAALYYTEWTFEFRNESEREQEARAQIQLPTDGVVTRLTLWIADEEREAAFGGRGATRKAYQSVVRARRDPVLVTTSGPGRVLIQCFPVPARGTMKTRIGIVAPLELPTVEQGSLVLPHFLERNFGVAETKVHSVWIEPGRDGGRGQREMLSDGDLLGTSGRVTVARPSLTEAWSTAAAGGETVVVHQSLVARAPWTPKRVVLVVDGSRRLEGSVAEIAESLSALPPGVELTAIVAGDEVMLSNDPLKVAETAHKPVLDLLRAARFVGGADNVPALLRAWDIAAAADASAIVWVHGPQPVEMESVAPLRQCWERWRDGPRLYAVAVTPGPNRVLESLDGIEAVRTAPRYPTTGASLQALYRSWSAASVPFAERRRDDAHREGPAAHRSSDHLVRLWARDQARSRLDGTPEGHKAAVTLAARYRLVTPVTGAVVLETRQQYEAAGLDPDDPTQVSSVPEPELWLLLAIAGGVLLWSWRQKRSHVARLA
jgi:hypothetical protein